MPETFTQVLNFRMLVISSSIGGYVHPADPGVWADSKVRQVYVADKRDSQ